MRKNSRNACLLYDQGAESTEKDAVINSNRLQTPQDYLYDFEEGNQVWSPKDVKRCPAGIQAGKPGCIRSIKQSSIPESCWGSETSEIEQGSGKEPVDPDPWNVDHNETTGWEMQDKRPRETAPCRIIRSVRIKRQTRAVACGSSFHRAQRTFIPYLQYLRNCILWFIPIRRYFMAHYTMQQAGLWMNYPQIKNILVQNWAISVSSIPGVHAWTIIRISTPSFWGWPWSWESLER